MNNEISDIDQEFDDEMEAADELQLYLTASALTRVWQCMQEDLRSSDIKKDPQLLADLTRIAGVASAKFAVIAKASTKYGVVLPVGSDDIHSEKDGSPSQFRLWFEWWHNFIHALPEEDWLKLQELIAQKVDTSALRPPGKWKYEEDEMRDGVVKASHVLRKVDNVDCGRDFGSIYASKQESESCQKFKDFLKTDDEVWIFKNPVSEQEGYVAISNRRPIAMFTVILPKNE